ncbi:hypothetical protein BFP72_10030 [Reichenbachiella sp. 5M10]|uniref:DUF4381 domain-containing protein n=1 Tax=Reichenbachiella sp. 5M10 TaxID=1889772 RepID=UPI000C1551BD|nr:DUF4381 domain-containing protein [Reichenbachiella sp. 5M10]PIB35707.1 hypothetical protein BFP72_10030 [Reichenbachiella sp. 5M10]
MKSVPVHTIQDTVQQTQDTTQVVLQQLYEPAPIAFTFETIGWLILACILGCATCILIILQIRKYVKNRYRREALAELSTLKNAPLSQTMIILKRVAISVFGREAVGPASGRSWLQFLEKSAKGVQFVTYEESIQKALYTDQPVDTVLQQKIMSNAQKWIRNHAR